VADTDGIRPVIPSWPVREEPGRVERRRRERGRRQPPRQPPTPRRDEDDGRPHVDEYA